MYENWTPLYNNNNNNNTQSSMEHKLVVDVNAEFIIFVGNISYYLCSNVACIFCILCYVMYKYMYIWISSDIHGILKTYEYVYNTKSENSIMYDGVLYCYILHRHHVHIFSVNTKYKGCNMLFAICHYR